MTTLFWIFAFLTVYSYFTYPLILKLYPKRPKTTIKASETLPMISIIITAHNEELLIRDKIANTLDISYPYDKREIIVASDASDDMTDKIVLEYENSGVKLIRINEHNGKEYTQHAAIQKSCGEIIVFSDAATLIDKDALQELIHSFNDPAVGAVSSEDRFINTDGSIAGEGAYVRYEMWLRSLEMETNSLVGLSGSFFAARRDVCQEWDTSSPSDFNTALNCVKQHYIAISNKKVLGYYKDISDSSKEYRRKTRTVIRGWTAIIRHLDVLNPFKFGFFSFQVWSHKIMRWLVPWFLIGLLFTTTKLLATHWVYDTAFVVQAIFYTLATIGFLSTQSRNTSIVKIPYFFVQVNIAIAHATILFLLGKRLTVWTPSSR